MVLENRIGCGYANVRPVTRNGQLVALLTSENFGELMVIQAALWTTRGSRQAP